jgi:hypothetical protein
MPAVIGHRGKLVEPARAGAKLRQGSRGGVGALHDPHGSGEARRPPGAEMLVAWAGIHRQEVAGDVGTASLS